MTALRISRLCISRYNSVIPVTYCASASAANLNFGKGHGHSRNLGWIGTGSGGQRNFSSDSLSGIPIHPTSSSVGPVAQFLSDAAPVLQMQDLLYQLHDLPGMNWASTIFVTTLGIRLFVSLPLGVFQQKSIATLENLQPQIKSLATELNRETAIAIKLYNWSDGKAKTTFNRSFKKHWRALMEEHNCHPLRAVFLVWLQVPFWVCFSSALRNVVYVLPEPRTSEMMSRFVQMSTENTFWLDSLAVVDPFVFPAIFLAANLLNIQINSLRKLAIPQTTLQKVVPWVFRVGIVGITILASFTPAAVSMYWATSSVFALGQNALLKSRTVRRKLGIPTSLSQP